MSTDSGKRSSAFLFYKLLLRKDIEKASHLQSRDLMKSVMGKAYTFFEETQTDFMTDKCIMDSTYIYIYICIDVYEDNQIFPCD